MIRRHVVTIADEQAKQIRSGRSSASSMSARRGMNRIQKQEKERWGSNNGVLIREGREVLEGSEPFSELIDYERQLLQRRTSYIT